MHQRALIIAAGSPMIGYDGSNEPADRFDAVKAIDGALPSLKSESWHSLRKEIHRDIGKEITTPIIGVISARKRSHQCLRRSLPV